MTPAKRPIRRVYLASPYSHWCPLVRWWRWLMACRAAAALMAKGIHVYSPIVNGHWMGVLGRLPKDWDYWRRVAQREIVSSSQVWVLRLKGWARSEGVRAEMELARSLQMPVRLIRPAQVRLIKPSQTRRLKKTASQTCTESSPDIS